MTAESSWPPVLSLKKVTLRYSPAEDRIRLDALDGEGQVVVFWVTQRLCLPLVRTLVSQFDPSAGKTREGNATGAEHHKTAKVQAFLQEKARVERQVAVAVVGEAATRGILLENAQLRRLKGGRVLQLLLPLDAAATAVLSMSMDEARLLLDILYQQFKAGGWRLDIWPPWIGDTSASSTVTGDRVH